MSGARKSIFNTSLEKVLAKSPRNAKLSFDILSLNLQKSWIIQRLLGNKEKRKMKKVFILSQLHKLLEYEKTKNKLDAPYPSSLPTHSVNEQGFFLYSFFFYFALLTSAVYRSIMKPGEINVRNC